MTSRPRPAVGRAARPGMVRHPGTRGLPTGGPAPAGAGRPSFWTQPALWSALAAVLLYLPALRYGFVWDDHALIEGSGLLGPRGALWGLLTADFWAGSGGGHSGFWRPLITFSYWLDGRLSNGSPVWFHAMNVVFHAIASALVAAIVLEYRASRMAALFAGLWFASLPTHVECVAFVSGRTDVYCAAFLLFGFWLDRRARHAHRRWAGGYPVCLLAAALLSKEAAVGFVLIVAIAEWVERPETRPRIWNSAVWLAPYLLVTAIYLVLHGAWVGFAAGGPVETNPIMVGRIRMATIASFGEYLSLLLPWSRHVPGLAMKLPSSPQESGVVVGAVLHIAIIAWALFLLRRRAPALVPLGLYWLAFLPLTIIGLTQGRLLFGERFLYLPSAGAAWLLGLEISRWISHRKPPVPTGARRGIAWTLGVLMAVLVLAGAFTLSRMLPAWANDESLSQTKLRLQPEYADSHALWAIEMAHAGRDREAEAGALEALRLDPSLPLAHLVLGIVALRRGLPDSALLHARRALEHDRSSPEARHVEGVALLRSGRVDEAAPLLEALAVSFPDVAPYSAAWGEVLMLKDRPVEALPLLQRGLSDIAGVRNPDLHYKTGMAYAQLGRMVEARAEFDRAVALDSGHYDAWLRLALARFILGDRTGSDSALARAAALPQATNGAVEKLRLQIATLRRAVPPLAIPGRR